MDKLAPLLSILCGFLLWSSIMIFLIRILVLGLRSKSWPNIYGKIAQSKITKIKRSGTGSILSHYRAEIQYEYTINTFATHMS